MTKRANYAGKLAGMAVILLMLVYLVNTVSAAHSPSLSFEPAKGPHTASSSTVTTSPFINGNQTGYIIDNLTQGSSACSIIQRNSICYSISQVGSGSVGLTINANAYTLSLSTPVLVYQAGSFDFFAMLTNINTTSTPNNIELLIYSEPAGSVQQPTTIATTVAQNVTNATIQNVTASAAAPSPVNLPAFISFAVAIVLAIALGIAYSRNRSSSKK